MLRLHGFATSNYHNVVKLALLEKQVPFEEVVVYPPADASFRKKNPTGRFPCLETEDGRFLGETRVMLNYLEDAYREVPLLPADPFERARVRELMDVIDVYLEPPARRLYGEALFGGSVSDEVKEGARGQLAIGAGGVAARARFDPFIAGPEFSLADCGATLHLPLVDFVTRRIYGESALAGLPLDAYFARMQERPSVRQIREAERADQPEFMKRMGVTMALPS